MAVNTKIQLRRGTTAEWESASATGVPLAAGEIGVEVTTSGFRRIKIGDGSTAWNSLKYANLIANSGFIVEGTGIDLTYDALGSGLTIAVDTGWLNSYLSSGVLNVEEVQDIIGNSGIAGGFGINKSYDDGTGFTTVSVTGMTLSVGGNSGINVTSTTSNNNNVYTISASGTLLDLHTNLTASASELNVLDNVTAGTISASKGVVVDANKSITGFNNITSTGLITASGLNTTGDVIIGGNLTVSGVTTTVNSTTVNIGDNIIRVNTSGLSTGGFEVFKGGDSGVAANYESLVWNTSNTSWEFSGPKVSSTGLILGRTLESTVASPTAPIVVASTGLVTNLNSDYLDGQHGSYYRDYANLSGTPTIGSGTLSLGVTGSGLSGSASFGANDTGNTTFTVSINATPASGSNTVVSRDSTGSFSAGNITGAQFIGGGSGLTNLNASNISTGTLSSGLLPGVTVGSTSTGPSANFVSSVTTDDKGRVTSVNTTTHILATTGVAGIASFDNGDFSVAAGVVTIKTSGVANSQLENDSITIGQTELVLGNTYSAISGVSASSPVVLTYFSIDGGSP